MRVHKSKGQIQRKIKRDQNRKVVTSVTEPGYTEGPVHLGPNWSITENEIGQLVAHNVVTGQTVVLGDAE